MATEPVAPSATASRPSAASCPTSKTRASALSGRSSPQASPTATSPAASRGPQAAAHHPRDVAHETHLEPSRFYRPKRSSNGT